MNFIRILFKICILLGFSSSLFAQALQENLLNKKLSISCRDVPIKEALQLISEKTGVTFTYSSDLVSLPQKITLNVTDKTLRTVLNQLFSETTIDYKIVGNQVIFQARKSLPKKYTISGYIREEGSGELLTGVNIYVPSLKTGTVTNTYGFYSLTLPGIDTITVIYSFVGFTPVVKKIDLLDNHEMNISLIAGKQLNEVIVNADANAKLSESAQMSTISIPVSQIKNIPSLLGEKDVFKVLQLMPGVQKGMEGSSGLYVRGGGPDQNLIILDDAIVYNASHLFGFFSLFNGDALKSVELTKGGFPARYGGRLSSVIDINMKEGNKEAWHGEGGIGLISSRLTVEGPLKKNKSSVLLSGRRTYLDFVSKPLTRKNSDGEIGYYFYDFNAKINYDFGRNKLYLSGYFGKDLFSMKNNSKNMDENAGFNWGNTTGTLRWNHLFNNKLFSNTSIIYSDYKFQIHDKYKVIDEGKDFYAEYNSGITDYSLKYDVDFIPNPRHWIKTGLSAIYHEFRPYAFVEEDNGNEVYKHNYQTIKGVETGYYIEDTYHPFDRLKLNGGLRYSLFFSGKKQHSFLEPRISMAFRLKEDLALKASYASMNQYIHLLSNTGIGLPTDLWVPSTERVHPQQSSQVAIGIAKDLSKPLLSISLEGYYKKMSHIIGYKEGASYININEVTSASESSWEDNVTPGKGWSYGVEFLVQKKEGKFSGWIGYTLSWTLLQFDSLNFGRKYYARYDRRHDISLVGIYKISKRITLSATWVYGTGNALSLPVSKYTAYEYSPQGGSDPYYYHSPKGFSFSGIKENFENKNDYRMGAYHRLDIGIQFHKQKKWGERTWEISVYNAYNRQNPFFYYSFTDDETQEGKLKQVSLFPIVPTVTYSFKF
jgi:hypothetical protein